MANAAKADDKEKQRIVTPEFRVSYPHLFKPNAIKGGKLKYSVTMLFDKKQDLSVLKLAIKHAKISGYGPNEKNWPTKLESPVSDGDSEKYADKEGYKGCWVVKASTNEENRPGVVDKDAQPLIDASSFYPGCYARAQVFAFTWEYMGKEGVSFILDHVQKTRDGKSFSGKKSATEVFDPITGGDSDDDDTESVDNDDFT